MPSQAIGYLSSSYFLDKMTQFNTLWVFLCIFIPHSSILEGPCNGGSGPLKPWRLHSAISFDLCGYIMLSGSFNEGIFGKECIEKNRTFKLSVDKKFRRPQTYPKASIFLEGYGRGKSGQNINYGVKMQFIPFFFQLQPWVRK